MSSSHLFLNMHSAVNLLWSSLGSTIASPKIGQPAQTTMICCCSPFPLVHFNILCLHRCSSYSYWVIIVEWFPGQQFNYHISSSIIIDSRHRPLPTRALTPMMEMVKGKEACCLLSRSETDKVRILCTCYWIEQDELELGRGSEISFFLLVLLLLLARLSPLLHTLFPSRKTLFIFCACIQVTPSNIHNVA